MKKIITMLAVLMFGMAIAGCSNGDNENKTRLKIAFAETGYGREWLENIVEAFEEEHPDVYVELDGNPNMTANAGPQIENGRNLSDIYFILDTNWQNWATRGFLEDLNDLYDTEIDNGNTLEDKLIDGIVDFGKVGDSYYAVPWNDGVTGLVYNAGMFDKFGWEVPETYDELVALTEQIKTEGKGVKPFTWPGQYSSYWNFVVYGWWAQMEGIEGMEEFFRFESPEVYKQEGKLAALEAFEELIGDQSNSVNGVNGLIHTQAQIQFMNGLAAMIPNGIWIENETKAAMSDDFEMRMMPLPVLEGAKDSTINNTMVGDSIVIPKGAPQKALAKEFIKFMSTDEMLMQYTSDTGSPRPFEYDPTTIEGLSEFIQSALEIWKTSNNFYIISDNPMYYANDLNTFPKSGAPYGDIYLGDTNAEKVWQDDYTYVVERWDEFRRFSGLD